MSRGLWIEVTNPDSPHYKDAIKTALNTAYHTFETSHSFVKCYDVFKKELSDNNRGSKGNQDDKLHCIDVALLGFERNKDFHILDCWKAAERLVSQTGFTHIGLANCTRQQLTHILKHADKQPKYIQVEASVHFPNASILALARTANLIPIASAVFGKFSPSLDPSAIMPIEEEVVKKIADVHHKSAGQVLVKHALQRGLCPLIKSNSQTRIIAYSEVDDFELTKEEMHVLNTALVKRR
ncbi:NADH-dependent D-xylose reductase [Taenia solium]|eukprot:TsM_000597000 transcript=TsM_000597000 gene=TsM_000597000